MLSISFAFWGRSQISFAWCSHWWWWFRRVSWKHSTATVLRWCTAGQRIDGEDMKVFVCVYMFVLERYIVNIHSASSEIFFVFFVLLGGDRMPGPSIGHWPTMADKWNILDERVWQLAMTLCQWQVIIISKDSVISSIIAEYAFWMWNVWSMLEGQREWAMHFRLQSKVCVCVCRNSRRIRPVIVGSGENGGGFM